MSVRNMFLCAKCALCQMFRSARACAAEMHMNMSKEFAHGNLQKKCRTQIRRPPFCASLRNNHFLWKFTGEMSNPADTTSIEHRALESFQSGSEWFPTGFHFASPPFSLAWCKLACCMPTVLTLTSPMMIMRSRVRKCYLELYFETCEMFALWNDVWDETLKWFCYHLFVTRWDADYSEPIAWSVTNKMRIIFDNSGLYAWSRQKLTKPVKTQHHTRIKKKTRNKTIDLNVAGQMRQVVETPSPAARSHQFYFFSTVVSNRKRNPCGWAFMVS